MVALVLVVCFGSVLAPASATTAVQANTPFEFWGRVYGTNARNNTCNSPAVNCSDRTYLERSSWQGYRKFDSSERLRSGTTGPGCMNGMYDWKTAHRAKYYGQSTTTLGVTIAGTGVTVGLTSWQWSKPEVSHWSSSRRLTTSNC